MGRIVGARMADAGVTKTVKIFDLERSTVSKAMTAFEIEGKISSKLWKKAKAVWEGLSDCYAVC